MFTQILIGGVILYLTRNRQDIYFGDSGGLYSKKLTGLCLKQRTAMKATDYINWEYISANGGFNAETDVETGFFERICTQVAHAMGRQVKEEDVLTDKEKEEVLDALESEYPSNE